MFLNISDKKALKEFKKTFDKAFKGKAKTLEYLSMYYDSYLEFVQALNESSDDCYSDTIKRVEQYKRQFEVYKKKVNFEKIISYNNKPEGNSLKLEIELVPETSSRESAQKIVKESEWHRIKFVTHGLTGFRCEICNGLGTKHPLECHEVWSYDAKTNIQKLIKFKSLCPLCHDVKHLGNSGFFDSRERAVDRFVALNNIPRSKAEQLINKAESLHIRRSKKTWRLDFSILSLYNITPSLSNIAPSTYEKIIFNPLIVPTKIKSVKNIPNDKFDPSALMDIKL